MEDYIHYSEQVYQNKLKELDLLPLKLRFELGDLKLFYKIINGETCIRLPDYLELISPDSEEFERLRRSHKDPLYFVCNIDDRVNVFRHSFFYRAHNLWNRLPLNLRLIRDYDVFSVELRKHLVEDNEPDPDPD